MHAFERAKLGVKFDWCNDFEGIGWLKGEKSGFIRPVRAFI
jgi:hypothetical protein